jgi:hypothetical protein
MSKVKIGSKVTFRIGKGTMNGKIAQINGDVFMIEYEYRGEKKSVDRKADKVTV